MQVVKQVEVSESNEHTIKSGHGRSFHLGVKPCKDGVCVFYVLRFPPQQLVGIEALVVPVVKSPSGLEYCEREIIRRHVPMRWWDRFFKNAFQRRVNRTVSSIKKKITGAMDAEARAASVRLGLGLTPVNSSEVIS